MRLERLQLDDEVIKAYDGTDIAVGTWGRVYSFGEPPEKTVVIRWNGDRSRTYSWDRVSREFLIARTPEL